MYYSIVPLEEVFVDYDTFEPCFEIIQSGEMRLQVRNKGNNKYELIRIYSSNPQDYLNPQFQPGLEIELNHLRK